MKLIFLMLAGYCLHDGLCVLPYIDQQKECKCINGWNGFRCEQNPVCTNFYCFNGGTCMPNPDSRMLPTCKCAQGYAIYFIGLVI